MSDTERLRKHPEDRFAPAERVLDLKTVAAELAAEPQPAHAGHRQRTIFKHGALTVAVFVFEPGGHLDRHIAAGTVIIQVIDGALTVRTPGKTHALSAGQLLILAASVPHDVEAPTGGRMLLTVQLDRRKTPEGNGGTRGA